MFYFLLCQVVDVMTENIKEIDMDKLAKQKNKNGHTKQQNDSKMITRGQKEKKTHATKQWLKK